MCSFGYMYIKMLQLAILTVTYTHAHTHTLKHSVILALECNIDIRLPTNSYSINYIFSVYAIKPWLSTVMVFVTNFFMFIVHIWACNYVAEMLSHCQIVSQFPSTVCSVFIIHSQLYVL